jgi:dienelactone hydrolase
MPYSADTPPLVLAPASEAAVQDRRGRFREIFCAVLESHGHALPDYRPCEAALNRVGNEPASTGQPVDLGPSKRRLIAAEVPGIGYACIEGWLRMPGTVTEHLRRFGYDAVQLKVDALSSSENNARQIRDAIMAMPLPAGPPRLVLVGYSKGAPDVLEAVVAYPEIRSRVVAVVSAAGAVAGSPLADDAEQYQADLLRYFPDSTCDAGDGGGVASLRPATRLAWLARNPLPRDLHYYSLVTFPQPESISRILRPSYHKLARIDARNDSQLIFYDQVVPGSILMGYLNADHWAVAVPIDREHRFVTSLLATENAYPREALLEAVLRFVEEDLAAVDKGRE